MRRREELQANNAVWAMFYRDGMSLGEIAKTVGCSVFDLSPWLTAPITNAVLHAASPDMEALAGRVSVAVDETLRACAPGLSEPIRAGIVRSIRLKVAGLTKEKT